MGRPHLLLYVVAWTALVAAVLLGASGIDGDDHAQATSGLLALRRQQAEFDDLLHHVAIDPATRPEEVQAAFTRLEGAVMSLPLHVDLDRHPAATSALTTYMDGLSAARESVQRYAALAELIRARSDGSARAGGSGQDEHDTAQFVEQLRTELAGIDAAGLPAACDTLLSRYETSFGGQLDDAEVYRLCLYLITGLLLVRLVQSMRELQVKTDQLRTMNRTLEDRVDDRTRTLSATNRALESAIAEARRAERDARSAREAAETANRTKSSFLANMSHEIRTPMTSILGFSERLLEEGLTEPERADAVATIRRNGEHLMQLVSDILDLSKIEAGRLAFEPVPCSPHRIVADMRDALASRAQDKGLEFVVEWKGPTPREVRTDPLRLEQILFNLVGNAIKFTDRGRIRVRVGYEAPKFPRGSGKLEFEVEDSGIGMDEATLARLFRPFVQGDSSTTRRFGGTGLGLSICSHLVDGLGGRIQVASRPGQGSTFTFHVDAGPLEGELVDAESCALPPAIAPGSSQARLDGLQVLLAEDGEDNRRLLRHILTSAGAMVSLAVDGVEAVELALAARATGKPFDVLVMDMQMPRLDGYEATRQLRAAGYQGRIMALTANAMAPDRDRCLRAGCDDYCTKPVRRAVLLERVGRWRTASIEGDGTMPKRTEPAVTAEQDEGLLELVRLFVEELGQDVGAMRTALASSDMERLALLAHRLKGAAGSYGFPEITRQAGLLEAALRGGRAPEEVACELASLEVLCAAARAG